MHHHLVHQALDQGVADAPVDRTDQVDPAGRQRRRDEGHGDDAPGPQPPRLGVATHHGSVIGHVGRADLVDARRCDEGAGEVVEQVALRQWLEPGGDPTWADHDREALGQRAQHLIRDAAGPEDDRGTQFHDRYTGGGQHRAHLLAADQVGRQVAPAQAAQVDDAPHASRFGSPAEGGREVAVAGFEPGSAGHGVHQVVGGIGTRERAGGGLRVGHVDGHRRDPLTGGQGARVPAQGQHPVAGLGQLVGQQAAHVAAGPGDGDPRTPGPWALFVPSPPYQFPPDLS